MQIRAYQESDKSHAPNVQNNILSIHSIYFWVNTQQIATLK